MRTSTTSGPYTGPRRLGLRQPFGSGGGGGGGGPSGPQIEYASNISGMLAAIGDINNARYHIGWHGMSIIAGIGSDGSVGGAFTGVWRTDSIAPTVAANLAATYGGAQSLGAEVLALQNTGNAFFTLGGGAALTAAYNAVGPGGQFVSLSGAGAGTISFTVNAYAGQVCRVYAYLSGGSGIVTPRYSISGANTVATTDLPTGAGTDVTPVGSSWWYTADITLDNAGSSTVTLRASVTSGHNFNVYMVDADYRTDAGLSLHRMGYSGKGIGDHLAKALDNTDTVPAGNWIGGSNANRRQCQFDSLTSKGGIAGAFVSFDVNDIQHYNSYAWSLAKTTTHYQNIIAAYAAKSMPALFITGLSLRNPAAYSGAPPYDQAAIIGAIRTAVAASSNCALLDLYTNWAGADNSARYASQVTDTSKWIASESPNYLHPNLAGHQMFAGLISDAIIAAI